jgi:hypothetical protein
VISFVRGSALSNETPQGSSLTNMARTLSELHFLSGFYSNEIKQFGSILCIEPAQQFNEPVWFGSG